MVNLNPATIPLRKPVRPRARWLGYIVEGAAYAAAFLLCGMYLGICVVALLRKDQEEDQT